MRLKLLLVIVIIVVVLFIFKKVKREVMGIIGLEVDIAKKVQEHDDKSREEWRKAQDEIDAREEPSKRERGTRKISEENKKYRDKFVKKSSSREEKCRDILEEYFQEQFPKVRPKFLRNPETNRPLELDGYNAKRNLAFEYNGKQHYEYPNSFHKNEEEFQSLLRRDKFKAERCEELGIKLITIPYDAVDLKEFILSQL